MGKTMWTPASSAGGKRTKLFHSTGQKLGYKRSMDVAKKAARLLAEKKEVVTYLSSNIYGGTTTNGTVLSLLNSIAQGSDSTNRIGRKVKHEYIMIDIFINTLSPAGDAGFWSIVLDRQPNGGTPNFSDIYDATTVTNVGLAPKGTLLYQDRFKVLAVEDWAVAINTQGAPYKMRRYINMANAKGDDSTANFNGTGSGIGNINQGAVFFVATNSYANILSAPTTVVFGAKYRFTDV